jgi:hypothetical protein
MLLMLEDDADRLDRFTTVWKTLAPGQPMRVWRTAMEMVREVGIHLPDASLISLDHDLEPVDGIEPGDGMDVARYLASLSPCCPVIVHTSNGDRGTLMMGELELAGWNRHRVYPIGDDWIESDWGRIVKRVLRLSGEGQSRIAGR